MVEIFLFGHSLFSRIAFRKVDFESRGILKKSMRNNQFRVFSIRCGERGMNFRK